MDFKELLKKIHSLRDLRAAINEVKTLQKDAKVIPLKPQAPAPAQPMKEQHRGEAKQELGGSKSFLKHLGLKDTGDGKTMTHMIGMPGANWGYEVKMDMHNSAQGKPSFTVHHVDSQGNTQTQSPKLHSTIGSAIKDLVGHSHSGKWSDK